MSQSNQVYIYNLQTVWLACQNLPRDISQQNTRPLYIYPTRGIVTSTLPKNAHITLQLWLRGSCAGRSLWLLKSDDALRSNVSIREDVVWRIRREQNQGQ